MYMYLINKRLNFGTYKLFWYLYHYKKTFLIKHGIIIWNDGIPNMCNSGYQYNNSQLQRDADKTVGGLWGVECS